MSEAGRIKILYIEDEEVDFMALERMVKRKSLPYDVDHASSLVEAAALLEKNGYNIVLVDYMLPDGTGIDIIKKIKGAPVVMMTGHGDETVAVRAIKEGAYDYIMKEPTGDHLKLLPTVIDKTLRGYYLEEWRLKADRALKASERKFRGLVDNSLVGVYKSSVKGEFLYVNEALSKMLGYAAPGEMTADGALGTYKRPEERRAFLDALMAGGELNGYGLELVTKTGGTRDVLISATLEDDTISGMIMDITDLKHLQLWHERVKRLLEDLIALKGLDEKLQRVADGVVEIFGIAFAGIWLVRPGDQCTSGCIHAGSNQDEHACIKKDRCLHFIAGSGDPAHMDTELHSRVPFGCYDMGRLVAGKDSKFILNAFAGDTGVYDKDRRGGGAPVSFAAYKIVSRADGPVGVLALFSAHEIFKDEDSLIEGLAGSVGQVVMTAAAEEALEKSLSMHLATIESTADGILVVDRAGKIKSFNRKFQEMWRIPDSVVALGDDEKVVEFVLDQLRYPEDFFAKVRELYDQPEAESFDVLKFKDERVFERYSNPQRVGPEVVGRVWNFRDITERKRAERALLESEKMLRKAQRMEVVGSLVAGVAHEVRNPLNSLMAVTEALFLDLGDKPEYKTYLFHIRTQVERLTELMSDLLEYGKPEETKDLQRVDVTDVCKDAVDAWKQLSSNNSFDLAFIRPDTTGPVEVMAHGQRLKQVFLNLLDNASHHSPGGGAIKIAVEGPGAGFCRVKVVDRGTGIHDELLPRIFEPFFSTRRGGTGLGLSIVKNTVESYGGKVALYNNDPGPGCTAEVALPAAPGEREETNAGSG